jgi:serine/threonine protein kinase
VTSNFSPERWEKVQDLVMTALSLDTEARQALLKETRSEDPSLAEAVRRLLESGSEDETFLIDTPVSLSPHGRSLAGAKVRQYEILELLGRGGMGVVYKARDTKLDRLVALKFLPALLSDDDEVKARFIVEARAAASLEHPNICRIHEIGETEDGQLFIAMSYYEGESLKSVIKRGPVQIDDALAYTIKIAEGLVVAHGIGTIHRDIKPANVMILDGPSVKIVDFGLAKLAGTRLSRTGTKMGTAAYMSPEQAEGKRVDHRTDIWSLGVMLYEMLAGRRPFSTEFDLALLYSVVHVEPQPVEALRPDTPTSLANIVARAMEKDPDARYGSAGEMLDDLRDVVSELQADHRGSRGDFSRETRLSSSAAGGVSGTAPLQILVVDDEPSFELLMQKKFRRRIRSADWTFHFARNGVEALDVLRTKSDIELVLTDLNMPEMGGLALLAELEGLNRLLKPVVISAYDDMGNIRTAMNRGAFDFVTKPVDFADLEKTIIKTQQELAVLRKAHESVDASAMLEADWRAAADLHDAITMTEFPSVGSFDVFAFTSPRREVASDFYDFFRITDERLGFALGQVAGVGVSSAIFATMVRPLLRSIALNSESPESTAARLQDVLSLKEVGDTGLSFIVGIADAGSGLVGLANSGLPSPVILKTGAEPVILDSDETRLSRGDKLLMTTRELSPANLPDSIPSVGDVSAARIVRDVVGHVLESFGGSPPAADVTVAVLAA